jgi:hypothetical protein
VDPETGEIVTVDGGEVIIDEATGEIIAADGGEIVVENGGGYVAGVPVATQASAGWGPYTGLLMAALAVLLALMFAPPIIARSLASRRPAVGSTGGESSSGGVA